MPNLTAFIKIAELWFGYWTASVSQNKDSVKYYLAIIIILFSNSASAQTQDVWIRFFDTTTQLSGYKDLKGNIKLPAKFGDLSGADSFYHIIAVTEVTKDSYQRYYLLKDGRKVGHDSVYVAQWDPFFDCESEGKIIFKDWKADKEGFLDKNGMVIIPAMYNYVTPFRNGLAVARQGAKKDCWDSVNCEMYGWIGGDLFLINDRNEILADIAGVDYYDIDWYSKKENEAVDTSIYISFKGRNNITYSFLNHQKEFNHWFYHAFLPQISSLEKFVFDEMRYSIGDLEEVTVSKKTFLKLFSRKITSKRFEPTNLKEVSLYEDQLFFDSKIFNKYRTACGLHNRERFPLYDVMITYHKTPQKESLDISQEHFKFLRTENGYKLISISLK